MNPPQSQAPVFAVLALLLLPVAVYPQDIPFGQELLIQGSSGSGHQNLQRAGFENAGRIRMESINGQYSSSLTITDGRITNAPTGEIVTNPGSGGARNLTGNILNRGLVQNNFNLRLDKPAGLAVNEAQWNVAAGSVFYISGGDTPVFHQKAGTLNILGGTEFSGIEFRYEGGSIAGTVYMLDSQLKTSEGSAGSGSFLFSGNNARLQGNLYAGQSIWLRGDARSGHSSLRALEGFTNDGEMRFESINGGYSSNFRVEGTLTNRGKWISGSGTGGARVFTGNLLNSGEVLINQGTSLSTPNGLYDNAGILTVGAGSALSMDGQGQTFRQSEGALTLAGGLNIWNSRFEYLGGAISGRPYLVNSTAFLGGPGEAAFIVSGASANFEGNIFDGQSIWVRGDNTGSHTTLTSAGSFENRGTILLESAHGGYTSNLAVTEGTVRNRAEGIIRSGAGSGGSRFLRGSIENDGLLDVAYTLTLEKQGGNYRNQGHVNIASGATLNVHALGQEFTHAGGKISIAGGLYVSNIRFNHSGGSFEGTPYLVNTTLDIQPGAGLAYYIVSGSGTTISGNLAPHHSIWVRGENNGSHTRVVSASGFENAGLIRLESIHGGYNSSWAIDGRLTNALTGTIRIAPGSGGPRNLETELLNLGLLEANYGFTLVRANAVHENRGRVAIAVGQTMNVHGGGQTFLQKSGTFEINGGFYMTDAAFDYQGGQVIGTPYLVNSALNFGAGAGAASFIVSGSNTRISGNLLPQHTLWVRGENNGSHTRVVSASGFENAGLIRLESIHGGYNSSWAVDGRLTNATGGTIRINPGSGGPRNVEAELLNLGRFEGSYSFTLVRSGAAHENRGTLIVAPGQTMNVHGNGQSFIQRAGSLQIDGGLYMTDSRLEYLGGVLAGTPYLINAELLFGPDVSAPGNFVLSGSGSKILGNVPLNNTVWIRGEGNGSHTTVIAPAGLANGGTLRLESINGGYNSSFTVAGTLSNLTSGAIIINPGAGGPRNLHADFLNEGRFEANYSMSFNKPAAAVVNSGEFIVSGGQSVSMTGDYTQRGGFTRVIGTLDPAGLVDIRGGNLSGTGAIAANVNSGGIVTPGTSIGVLRINGSFSQEASGIFEAEIASAASDVLQVTGNAALDGTLVVRLLDGFVPAAGNSFVVLTSPSVTGKFARLSLPPLPAGLIWEVSYVGGVTLKVAASGEIAGTISGTVENQDGVGLSGVTVSAFTVKEMFVGLRGEYFQNSNLTEPALTRADSSIDFNWVNGSPHASIGADTFSVRWTGYVHPSFSEEYTFYTVSDDGVRLWVNGELLLEDWTDHAPTENSGTIALQAGEAYEIRMEYFENGGGATARLLWSSASQPKVPIPSDNLTPSSIEGIEPSSSFTFAVSTLTDSEGRYSLDVAAGDWIVGVSGLPSLGYDSPPDQETTVGSDDVFVNFVASPYSGEFFSIELESNPPGTGIFSGGGAAPAGSSISVLAMPNTASKPWLFVSWTEDGLIQSTEPEYTFIANRDRTLRANFQLPTYSIAAQVTPEGSGSVSGVGSFLHDKSVVLQAIPSFGWKFEKWTENGADVSTSPRLAFTATGTRTLTAHFVTTIPANLTVPEVVVPETALMAQPMTVVYTLHNSGAEPASGPWLNRFSLATNATEGTTINLGSVSFNGTVAAESSLVVTQSLILPKGLVGDYFLMVEADSNNRLQEVVETDNTGSSAETFTILAADLVAEIVEVSSEAQFGQSISLRYLVQNAGNTDANVPFTDRIELVGENARHTLLNVGAGDKIPIAPEGAYERTVNVQLPLASGFAPGAYSIVLTTDARSEQAESREDNNAASSALSLALPPLPDLAVTEVLIPFVALPGSEATLIWTITNKGPATTQRPWRETLFVSADDQVGADQVMASFDFDTPLAAGESVTRTNVVPIPVTLAGNLRWVIAVDSAMAVVEGDESNNSAITPLVTSIPLKLTLALPFEVIAENRIPPSFRGRVSRSGPVTSPLLVALSSSDPNEITVPENVLIPAGSAAAEFDAAVHPDGVVDGPKEVVVTGTAESVSSSSDTIRVIDIDVPSLTLEFEVGSVQEGATVSATVSRSITTTNDVEVSIAASSLEVLAPSTVIIPAGTNRTTFAVLAVDDDRLELLLPVGLSVAAAGYLGDNDQINVVDNDDPGLSVKLENVKISEGAGGLATGATVTRQVVTSKPLLVQIRASDSSETALAPTVVIPGNVSSAFFYISAVNDTLFDGEQEVVVSAFVADPATGEAISSVATALLTVTDDDGPALRISLSGTLAREGRDPAVTAVIRRNTDASEALMVQLTSSDSTEATVPETATIAAGEESVSVPVVSLNDSTPDGNQSVTISVSSDGFAGASANLIVSDSDLPDLVVSNITAPASGLTKAQVSVGYTVTNQGFDAAFGNFTQKVYLSKDTVLDAKDTLISTLPFIGEIGIGQSFSRSLTIFLPGEAGTYWVFVVCDSEKTISESIEENNLAGTPVPIQVNPAYTATVQTELTAAPAGTPIPLTGRAVRPDNSPAAAEVVSIHISVQGQRRTIAAITDLNGNFSTVFNPLQGEAGSYEIGATHPGVKDFLIQDRFTLLGLRFDPVYVSQTFLPGSTITNEVFIRNLSDRPLTGLTMTVGAIEGLDVNIYAPDQIAAHGAARVLITATAPEARDAVGRYLVLLGSNEGAEATLTVDYKIELPLPRLVATPAHLRSGMVRDAQTLVEFEVTNLGGAETGPLDITLPALPWLRSITASPMSSLQPGESANITLQLAPDSSLTLGEFDGRLAVGNAEVGLVVPFVFRHVSEAVGDVSISAVDENTYYGENKSKVAGAEVILRDVYTSEILFKGVTSAEGVLLFNSVPEGPYTLEVSAPKHDTWLQTIEVKPGKLSEFTAFLRTQLVRYNWKVEEVDIEERATITLESTFETTVPVPVVTIEPGVVDLTGRTEDEVQIEFKVTNQGLIAAQEVALRFEDGSTWTVHPLTDEIGVIPAKSSITVPVVFRKKTEPQALARQSFAATPRTVDECRKPSLGFDWQVVCGPFDVAYWAPVPVVDMGLCPPPPLTIARDPLFFLDPLPVPPRGSDPGGPGRRGFAPDTGWGIRNFVGFQGTNDCNCVKAGFEEKCKETPKLDVKLDLGEKMKEAINLALQRIAWTRLMSLEVKFEGGAKLCTCCELVDGHEIRGLRAEGSLGATITGSIFLGPSLAHEGEVSIPGLTGAKGSFFIGGGAQATLTGSGKITGKTKCLLTDPEACIEGSVSFTSFVGIKGNGSIEGKNGEVTIKGEAEVEGGIDVGMNAGVQVCIDKNGTHGKIYACTDPIVLKSGGKVSLKASEGDDELPFEQSFGMAPKELIEKFCAEQTFGDPTPNPPPNEAMLVAALLGHNSPAELVADVTGSTALSHRLSEASSGHELSDAIMSGLNTAPEAPSPVDAVVYQSKLTPASTETERPLARQSEGQKGICAQVRLQIDQQAVVTRKAIRATLEVMNESDAPLENAGLTIQIYDSLGQLANDRFIILPPELTTLQAVETSPADRLILGGQAMRLAAASTGSAKWTILPKDEAAPEEALRYFVGGYLSYTSEGIPATAEMVPAPVNVYPNAKIYLKYFHQRDVFSDDPFTPQVEPSIPYVLGVMVQNKGKGVARNFSITSAQPQIVDNLKGLLIDFSIVASEVAGKSLTPSLSVTFGDVQPGDTSIGRWLLKSTLQGLFIDYKATLQHEDIFGEKGASVFEGVEIHELIKQVEALGTLADGKPDFLANDIADPDDLPDTLHLSDGSVVPVDVVRIGTTDGSPHASDLEVQLSLAMPAGWAYVRIADPADGQFRLAGVRRSDGVAIPVDVNAWVTDRTFVGMGRPPRYENTLHLLDHGSTGSYTLIYARDESTPDTTSPSSSIAVLSPNIPALIPVRWTGSDDETGSGIATYDIYVSVDDGPFLRWLEGTRNTSGLYQGAAGRKYAFYSVAKDNAGNYEQPPVAADAVTLATGNSAPVIAAMADAFINEGETFTAWVIASDADLPGDTLTYWLVSGPEGAQVDPVSGQLRWTTGEADGPATHTLIIGVSDNGDPAMSAERSIRVTVGELNSAPQITLPTRMDVDEGVMLAFNAAATDVDLPPNNLRYAISGAPAGAVIDAVTGQFQWTPGESDGGTSHSVTIQVNDHSTPNLVASGVVVLNVNEVNAPPTIEPFQKVFAYEADTVRIQVAAADSDVPAQQLAYSLGQDTPEGVSINAEGLVEWIPSDEQAGDHVLTIVVTDDAEVPASAFEELNIRIIALKPGLNDPRRLANGQVTFRVKASPGASLQLLASTDLAEWTPVQELIAPEPIFTLIDETSTEFDWRFFILREVAE